MLRPTASTIKGKLILILCLFVIELIMIVSLVWFGEKIILGTSTLMKAESTFNEFESMCDIYYKSYVSSEDVEDFKRFNECIDSLTILGTLFEKFSNKSYSSLESLVDLNLSKFGFNIDDARNVQFTIDFFKLAKGDSVKALADHSKVALDRNLKKAELFEKLVAFEKNNVDSELSEEIDKEISILINASHDVDNEFAANAKGMEKQITHIVILAVITATIILSILNLIAALYIGNSITHPIPDLVNVSSGVATGDLSRTINIRQKTASDIRKLIDSMNHIIVSLRDIIKGIATSSHKVSSFSQILSASAQQVNVSSQEIASSIQEVSSGAASQTERIDETSKLIEQVAALANQVYLNAQSAVNASNQAIDRSQVGAAAAVAAVEKMNNITSTITDTTEVIRALGKKSQHVGDIISTITTIADQTNLLALNAAIEAARAGESGKGFAIVAEEVRKLAEESTRAAKEIEVLIRGIQDETIRSVKSIEVGSKEVLEGKEIINNLYRTFEDINSAIKETSQTTTQISQSAQTQLSHAEQVVNAVQNVAAISQQSSASIQEISAGTEEQTASIQEMSATAQELAFLASELTELVKKFKVE